MAAINLYTQEGPLYKNLNAALRSNARLRVKPYWAYIRLLQHALFKLPKDKSGILFRGEAVTWVPVEERQREFNELTERLRQLKPSSEEFQEVVPEIWWGFSSTSTSLDAVKKFLGNDVDAPRVIFTIDGGSSARDVRQYRCAFCMAMHV